MVLGSKIITFSYDIFCGINSTVWEGLEGARKVSKTIKTNLSTVDVTIGTSHVLENFCCNDQVFGSLDVIGGISSSTRLILFSATFS